jgi:hypothetical protein
VKNIKNHLTTLAFLMIFLASCATPIGGAPRETRAPLTATSTPIKPEPTIPLQTPIPTSSLLSLTPDAVQVEQWKEYQAELARCVFDFAVEICQGKDTGSALCEWDIMGGSGHELYVWAQCKNLDSSDGKALVVYLERDGSIREVKYGRSKGKFFDPTLFPENVWETIFLYIDDFGRNQGRVKELRAHLEWRQNHPEVPPLVILSAIPQP